MDDHITNSQDIDPTIIDYAGLNPELEAEIEAEIEQEYLK